MGTVPSEIAERIEQALAGEGIRASVEVKAVGLAEGLADLLVDTDVGSGLVMLKPSHPLARVGWGQREEDVALDDLPAAVLRMARRPKR